MKTFIQTFLIIFYIGSLITPLFAYEIPDTIILGVEKDYPPFLFVNESNEPQGIAYDYSILVAEKLGILLIPSQPFQLQALLDGAKQGTIELFADITKTPERDVFLEFSNSYTETPAVVIGRKDGDQEWEPEKQLSQSVAVGKGYGVVSFLEKKYPGIGLIELDSDSDVIQAVSFGSADIGVLDAGSLSYLLQKDPLSNIEVIAETGFAYKLSFAVPESKKELIPFINEAIVSITQNERTAIYQKWLATIPERSSSFPIEITITSIGIIILLGGFGTVWIYSLRKQVSKRSREFEILNKELDSKVAERTKELSTLKANADQENKKLNDLKQAMLNVLDDIKLEKEKTEEQKMRLQTIIDNLPVGVYIASGETGKPEFVNRKAVELLGQKIDPELVDKELYAETYNLVHEDGSLYKDADLPLSITLRTKKPAYKNDITIDRGNGQRIAISANSVPVMGRDGLMKSALVVFQDITKERAIDKAKTEFVSLASHQLRTPLATINWYAEMLRDGDFGKFTKKQMEPISQIYESNQRMINLVNALLNVSRIDMGTLASNPEKIDISTSIHRVMIDFEKQITEKSIHFVKNVPEALPYLADPNIFEILIQNLVSNAIKYTPADGMVTLTVLLDKKGLHMTVADTGYGIPKSAQDKIFTKLYRADDVRDKDTDGNGLGLYLVKSTVEQHGGKIWFESIEGKGTTFFINLPAKGMKKIEGARTLTATI